MTDSPVPRASTRGPSPHGPVTLSHVARHVGVSAQSVSNALHNPGRVAPDTRERILSAVRELGYRPNRSARALRSQRSRLIGVKVEASRGDRAALLLDQFLHALAESAASAGCHLILCQADGEPEEISAYRELLDTTSVDAFVLASTHAGDARVAALRDWGVPFATFGRSWDGDQDLAWADVDGRHGLRIATEHVAAQGHRRIGHLGWPVSSETGRDRRMGWRETCERLGLGRRPPCGGGRRLRAGPRAPLTGCSTPATRPPPSPALRTPSRSACSGPWPTAACGRAPHVAVTGFDNSPAAALTTPGLTSLRQPLEQVAHDLVAAVESLLAGSPKDVRRCSYPELVVRESSLRGLDRTSHHPSRRHHEEAPHPPAPRPADPVSGRDHRSRTHRVRGVRFRGRRRDLGRLRRRSAS